RIQGTLSARDNGVLAAFVGVFGVKVFQRLAGVSFEMCGLRHQRRGCGSNTSAECHEFFRGQFLAHFEYLIARAGEIERLDGIFQLDALLSELSAPIDAAFEIAEEFIVCRILERKLSRDDVEGAAGKRDGLTLVRL